MTDDWTEMLTAIAGPEPTAAAYAVCERLTAERVGAKLFTVMNYDPATQRSSRTYSSDQRSYPLSGEKPLSVGIWSETVIDGQQPFIANTIEDIAVVFPDHPLIKSLGLGSVINVPVIVGGGVRATINILHEAGFYTPARVETAMALLPFYTVATLSGLVGVSR